MYLPAGKRANDHTSVLNISLCPLREVSALVRALLRTAHSNAAPESYLGLLHMPMEYPYSARVCTPFCCCRHSG